MSVKLRYPALGIGPVPTYRPRLFGPSRRTAQIHPVVQIVSGALAYGEGEGEGGLGRCFAAWELGECSSLSHVHVHVLDKYDSTCTLVDNAPVMLSTRCSDCPKV